jgi:hypothetical protein
VKFDYMNIDKLVVLKIYLLPIACTRSGEGVEGTTLVLTSEARGKYRRIGYFHLNTYPYHQPEYLGIVRNLDKEVEDRECIVVNVGEDGTKRYIIEIIRSRTGHMRYFGRLIGCYGVYHQIVQGLHQAIPRIWQGST